MNRLICVLVLIVLLSCKDQVEAPVLQPVVRVTVTCIDTTALNDFVDLNGVAAYTVNTPVRANATGYLERVNVLSNDKVSGGQVLFTLKTREAKVLGNTVNKLDPTLHFGGSIAIRATATGFIDSVNVNKGDYVQDGDLLGIIHNSNSFAIVVSVPYDLRKYLTPGKILGVFLPDGTRIDAKVQEFVHTVDPATQTQQVKLKPVSQAAIPSNLIVRVRIGKPVPKDAVTLPKASVLSNEDQSEFWIMKLLNDSVAVKIPIRKGIETASKVQILSPVLTRSDRILRSGNYGVADTIKVKIVSN